MNELSSMALKAEAGSSSRRPNTFQDLIDLATADLELEPGRRHNIASALRRMCALFHPNLATTTASHEVVRRHLDGFEPIRAGIKPKRFQNIRCDVNFALGRYVLRTPRGKYGLSPEWQVLWRLPKARDLTIALPSFIRFCSDRGIHPKAVSDAIASDYGRWICEESLRSRPQSRWRSAIKAWNKASETIDGWPRVILTVPSHRHTYCLLWETLPAPFRTDVEAYLAQLANPDPFDSNAPPKPARPKSIETYRFQIRQLVSALAIRGKSVQEITCLADLVVIENAKSALRFFHERGQKQVGNMALLLHKIGKWWCKLEGPALEQLTAIKHNLTRKPENGLTQKNRERLRPFTDFHNIEKLLLLPQHVYERVNKAGRINLRGLVDIQIALAVEILLMSPIRRANLVTLRIGPQGHIRPSQDRRDTTHIVIPGQEVKNGEELDFPLPRETAALLNLYLGKYRPLLPHADSDWLFPGEGRSGHKSLDQFSRQFTKTIRRLTGLTINMHLMRHIGAKLYLDRNPGAYEAVRRVLAHRSLSTTLNAYTGAETESAVSHFDNVILGIRNGILQETSRA